MVSLPSSREIRPFAVSVSGETLLVAAPRDDDNGPLSGSAHVFRHDGVNWVHRAELLASDGVDEDWFGIALALSAGRAIVGAYFDDDAGSASGSVYTFAGLSDCDASGLLDACEIALGVVSDLNGNGSPDVCDPVLGDLNGDGVVNIADLLALLASWGSCLGCPADLNGDGVVNIIDLLILLANWP